MSRPTSQHFRRLAASALAHGDPASARIYARQADEVDGNRQDEPHPRMGHPHEAAKLQAIYTMLLSAETEEDLAEARRMAARIQRMTDEEVQALVDELETERRKR